MEWPDEFYGQRAQTSASGQPASQPKVSLAHTMYVTRVALVVVSSFVFVVSYRSNLVVVVVVGFGSRQLRGKTIKMASRHQNLGFAEIDGENLLLDSSFTI